MKYIFRCDDKKVSKFLKTLPFKQQYGDISYMYTPSNHKVEFDCSRPFNCEALEKWLWKNKISFAKYVNFEKGWL